MKYKFSFAVLLLFLISFNSFAQYPDPQSIKANKIGMVVRYAEQGTDYFLYDENGREVKVSMSDPEFKKTYRNSKIYYNASQQPDSIIVTGEFNNLKEYYRYNTNGSYDVVTIDRGVFDTVFYNKNKKAIRSNASDGSSAKYEYSPQGQLMKVTYTRKNGSKSQTSYVYNAAGRIQTRKTISGENTAMQVITATYTYDKRGLLVKEVNDYGSSKFSTSYEYKPIDAELLTKTKEDVRPEPAKPVAKESPAFAAGDITPDFKSNISYNFPASDNNNNLYVVKTIDYRKGYLLKYDGKKWIDISPDANGWDYVYGMKVDKRGTVYLYGTVTGKINQISRNIAGKWDSVPFSMLNGNIRSLYINRNQELMARGKFNNSDGPYYLAKFQNDTWLPVGQPVNDKFLKMAFSDYSGSKVAEDSQGNLFMDIFRYSKPESRSYMVKWDGQQWSLLDTTANKFDASIPEIVVTKNSQIFFPGHFKNNNGDYSLVRWNGQQWEMISTNADGFAKDYLETVALDNDDNVYAAGWMKKNYEYALVKWTAGIGWESYATANTFITSMVVTPKCIFATARSGQRIFCFTPGSMVTEGKATPVAGADNPSTTAATLSIAAEKKDAKANEVWQIFDSYRATYKEKFKPFTISTDQVFERNENGKYKNQGVWKSQGYFIKQEVDKLHLYVDDYRKQLARLSLKEKENELYDAFLAYLNYSYAYLTATSNVMDELKYSVITPEAVKAVEDLEAMGTEITKRVNKLNPILTPYKKRNGIF